MDQTLLANSAAKLAVILLQYSAIDAEARALFDAVSSLISDASKGKICVPMEWRDIPGAYYSEGGLGKYGDLEAAFAEFRIEITGGESPALKSLRLNAAAKPTSLYTSLTDSRSPSKTRLHSNTCRSPCKLAAFQVYSRLLSERIGYRTGTLDRDRI